jgi:UDP-N-acetyl-2-amino-2-deoxyglucuronate dehydrogenase
MSAALRLGVVGCGDIAGYVAWFARLNSRIRISACCDISAEKAGVFARRFRIPRSCTSYTDLLDSGDVDAVYLAVPHHLHGGMICQAINKGLPVLVEKPLTRTLEEGQQVLDLSARLGVPVGVNYQYRYDSGCYALAQAARKGDLGRILYARANLPWNRKAAYFESSPWHKSLAESGGGTLLTQGSHMLDILLWAIPNPPIQVSGASSKTRFLNVEVEDLAMGMIEFEGGVLAQISSSMVAQPEQALTLEVYGESGTALYTDRPWPHTRFRGAKNKREKPPVRGVHALARSLEGFRRWIVEGQPYLIPAQEALPPLAVVTALYRSAVSGSKEPVSLIP